jgi:hypothetical protein
LASVLGGTPNGRRLVYRYIPAAAPAQWLRL